MKIDGTAITNIHELLEGYLGKDTPLAIAFDYSLQICVIVIKPEVVPSPIALTYAVGMLNHQAINEMKVNIEAWEKKERIRSIDEKMKQTLEGMDTPEGKM